METRNEIQAPVSAASAVNPADTAGDRPSDLALADSAAAPRATPVRRWVVRRWVVWVLLALPLGCAAYGFVHVNRPEACYRRALKALGRDDFDTARYELPRLQGLPEYEPHASLISGILLLQEHKSDDALEEFRLAADHPDTRALALTLAGRTLLRQRKFTDAEQTLHSALEYDPSLAEAHGCLGAAYFDVGEFPRSLAHLSKAAELSPADPRPYQFMATIHRTFHQDELAIEDLRELLRRGAANPSSMPPSVRQEALLDLAQLQTQLLRHQEAIDTLKDADDSPDSLALLAECQFALGDLEAARDCVARALEPNPDHFEALLVQGRLALEAKDFTSAVESLKRALKLRPKSQALHLLLSQALHALEQDDLAEQYATKAAQLRELDQKYAELCDNAAREPRNANTCFRLGLMAERLGMENAAAGWYRAVLLVDPRHATARERLSELPGGLANLGGQP